MLLSLLGLSGDAFIWGWSNEQLRAQIDHFELQDWGIARGARICLLVPNGPIAVVALLAALNRYCVVPCGPSDTAEHVAARLESSGCVGLVSLSGTPQAAVAAAAVDMVAGTTLIVLQANSAPLGNFELPLSPSPLQGSEPTAPNGGSDVVLVLHTSGTSGQSKRVPLTLDRLVASGRSLAACLGLTSVDKGLNMMPLHHVGGITTSIFAPLVATSHMLYMVHQL